MAQRANRRRNHIHERMPDRLPKRFRGKSSGTRQVPHYATGSLGIALPPAIPYTTQCYRPPALSLHTAQPNVRYDHRQPG